MSEIAKPIKSIIVPAKFEPSFGKVKKIPQTEPIKNPITIKCAIPPNFSKTNLISFEDAIIAAANHEGDSDSTAAICGNLIGAHSGLSAIPERYLERLELKELTLSLAERLAKRQD